jgi:hypothetical protein
MSFDLSNSNDVFRERLSVKERVLMQKAVIVAEKMKDI